MADYYGRLETQLADLTERGVPHRSRGPRLAAARLPRPRLRTDLVAVSLTVALTIAVGAVFLSHRARHSGPVPAPQNTLPVIRNYSSTTAPAPSGQLLATIALKPSGAATRPIATARIHRSRSAEYAISITASGLAPNRAGNVYAVWLLPAIRTISGSFQPVGAPVHGVVVLHPGELIGIIKPPVGPDGDLNVQGPLPQDAIGAHMLLITLQPDPSRNALGRTVLEGFFGL